MPPSGAGGVSERRTSPPAGVWSSRTPVRGRAPPAARSPLAARKGLPKELVSFGRHKLRRLSPGSHRKGRRFGDDRFDFLFSLRFSLYQCTARSKCACLQRGRLPGPPVLLCAVSWVFINEKRCITIIIITWYTYPKSYIFSINALGPLSPSQPTASRTAL